MSMDDGRQSFFESKKRRKYRRIYKKGFGRK